MPQQFGWAVWIYGMFAGFIGGGAGAVSSGFANMFVDPDHFNVAHPRLVLESMGTMFVVSGALSVFAYLKQSPLPAVVTVTTTTERTSIEQNPTTIVKETVQKTSEEQKP